jgi:hypothetical protein
MGETSRELVTSLSTDCDADSKAVVDFETAVSKATQDVWTVVRIPSWRNRSINDPVSIRHAYTKAGKDFSDCNISVQVCWKEEERRKAADSLEQKSVLNDTCLDDFQLPSVAILSSEQRSLPLSHR